MDFLPTYVLLFVANMALKNMPFSTDYWNQNCLKHFLVSILKKHVNLSFGYDFHFFGKQNFKFLKRTFCLPDLMDVSTPKKGVYTGLRDRR